MSVIAIAPALTIGLGARWCSSSSSIALNESPVGATPTRSSTASRPWVSNAKPYNISLEIDWMVKRCSWSPVSCC